MAMTIIDVPPDRYHECLEVLHAGFGTEVSTFGLTAENTPTNPAFWAPGDVARVVARPTQLFAVEQDGRVAGCAFVGASRRLPGTWILRHLAVHPDARHQGYGEALVAEAARRARAGGGATLRIGIIGENTRLSTWYQQLGFSTVGAGQHFPGLAFSVDHLELPLS